MGLAFDIPSYICFQLSQVHVVNYISLYYYHDLMSPVGAVMCF